VPPSRRAPGEDRCMSAQHPQARPVTPLAKAAE
jgi:hypothetical protein